MHLGTSLIAGITTGAGSRLRAAVAVAQTGVGDAPVVLDHHRRRRIRPVEFVGGSSDGVGACSAALTGPGQVGRELRGRSSPKPLSVGDQVPGPWLAEREDAGIPPLAHLDVELEIEAAD